ncbi:MAG TPA: nucleotidyltransferase family protein [Acidobacteriaceae bacterium]|nr:nucleotidyltransferase family protein [Acidobacteriaceae bacterium]
MPSKPRTDSLLVPAIVLAAGASSRLGQPKQLLRLPPFGGDTLIDHAIGLARAAGADPIFVVIGAHADEIQQQSQLPDCTVLRNESWAEGMASSIRVGISVVIQKMPAASGAIFLVCDQPGLTTEHLRQLLTAHMSKPENIAASRYAGRPGVPAVFPRALFPALLQLNGDRGARSIFEQPGLGIHTIEFPQGEWDIDSPEDLERLESGASGRAYARERG